jgi:hypothetical protein
MTDETIRLILDLASSSKDVSELVGKLDQLKGSADNVGESYEVLARSVHHVSDAYALSTTHVTTAEDAVVAAAVEHTRAQKVLNQVLEETAQKQAKAAGTSRDMQMRILNLGRAAQDLAQGGFAGILNNIEGIVGGGGLAAGVLTAIGTAAFIATPFIKKWVASLGEGAETFKPLVTGLDKFSDAITRNKKELSELKEKGDLTYWELLRYKELVNQTAEEEEKLANAREARQVKAGSDKASRARASAVKETIAERYGSGEVILEDLMAANPHMSRERAEELLAGAQKGFSADIQGLGNSLPGFMDKYKPFSPERKAQTEGEAKQLEELRRAKAEQDKIKAQDASVHADAILNEQKDQARAFAEANAAPDAQRQEAAMRGNVKRMIAERSKFETAKQERAGARQVQMEAAEQGMDINAGQALQIFKQRRAQEARLQAQVLNTVLGSQDAQSQRIAFLEDQLRMARSISRQQNRTAASNGIP